MSFSIDAKGFDELRKKLDRMKRNVNEASGEHSLKITELLNTSFLRKHTRFSSIEEMLASSGFIEESEKLTKVKFESIPDDDLNKLVSKESAFRNWDAMIEAATSEYVRNRVFDGV